MQILLIIALFENCKATRIRNLIFELLRGRGWHRRRAGSANRRKEEWFSNKLFACFLYFVPFARAFEIRVLVLF